MTCKRVRAGFDPTKVATPSVLLLGTWTHFAPHRWSGCNARLLGAALRYTLDGSEPTESSSLYDTVNFLTLNDLGEITLKVEGLQGQADASDIHAGDFHCGREGADGE